MKKYITLQDLKIKTPRKVVEVRRGTIIKLAEQDAVKMINDKAVLPFCSWTGTQVIDCVYPCFEFFDGAVSECKHLTEYWVKRLGQRE